MICNSCKIRNRSAQSVATPWRVDIQKGSKLLRMRSSIDSDMPFDSVPQSDDEEQPNDEQQELASQSANLKDTLLRSNLCRQPEATNIADEIIVDNVMNFVEHEQQAAIEAANAAAFFALDVVSPVTVTTDSSSDLE